METPRTYYNTITLTESTVSFIVGLIQEVYDNHAHQPARTRWLLAYQPHLASLDPALPVLHEQLHVLTANDWQQSNQSLLPTAVNDYFQTHDLNAVVTYFTTYVPQHPQPPMIQLLVGSQWPLRIQNAQQLLQMDLDAFSHHQAPTLPQAPLGFNSLGYFLS
ncbi:hypothetical protein [Lacticaseibacillus porcinae]|uniref:hypothetical protein n=1 Tax=Lacticaseibacillus porcinae TaxID=1123687 RepID=UPI000F79BBF2|nr:hypothetical protein [Lacticaseibacillus porcinae]